jgi:Tetrahydrodipicolinate N-succinyltransferase
MTEIPTAWGHGLATYDQRGNVLDVWFRDPKLGPAPVTDELWVVPKELDALVGEDPRRLVTTGVVRTESDLTQPVSSVEDAYLRLQLLSHLLVKPNSINLEGLIPALPIVAFSSIGSIALEDLDQLRPLLTRAGVSIHSVDKFPRLLDYVTPKKVRIADASRVRLGAHLSPGTTVMHGGFVNFNAGTLGASMVEGRISQGVIVDDGADIGGGASIMGTLSGGGKEKVFIGKRALLGANSGIGISIGDDTVVEAGLYVTAGTKLTLITDEGEKSLKALELSGVANFAV